MVNVIGMGYIGLPTTLMMASHGINVVGTDYNQNRVQKLNQHEIVFEEKGLKELMQEACEKGLKFSTEYQKADVYIVAVPTPYIKETKKIDPCYVVDAVRQVLQVAPPEAIIVLESTVAPGTMERFVKPLAKEFNRSSGKDIHFVHAPERIIPGNMVYELIHNSRTIGADSQEVADKVSELYKSFCQGTIVTTDIKTAEMTKVVENTFRDINIAYANELAKICNAGGMNVYEIIKIANMHPRVNILQPGPGVGGHCISVDPWFLVGDYPELSKVIYAARMVNDSMPRYVLERIFEVMMQEGISEISRVGIYGLTYKENVDDVRESPSLQIIECMEGQSISTVKFFDPFITADIYCNQYHDFDKFLKDIDIVVVITGHDQIKRCTEKLKGKVVLDTRNIFADENLTKLYKL